ncbi:MAG: methylenetetrahydrofolate reductase [NAD(P)H] [Candidatus Omnitrophica bacterium]|nr:methylenetetrahydrofolate reductase [NAD(P)H] [Candidatus Omnitrophota bacterium]
MKKVTEIFKNKEKTFSFELFPPKTDQGYQNLLKTIESLADLKPDFISCTYGAGGGSRNKTLDIVEHIEKEHHIPGVAHLTCVLNTKSEIQNILGDIQKRDIQNILALRGDSPKDNPDWQPTKDNFKYAYELCDFTRKQYQDYFSIGVAGFPEGHILCPNKELDAQYLKKKIDSGADYIITQLFFDNKDYFDYVKRLRDLGIKNRVIPGILPITDYIGVSRFCKTCGTSIPKAVDEIFSPIAENKDVVLEKGIDFCVKQCQDLLEKGAPGIHFYTLNKLYPINKILSQIKENK